MGKLVYAYITYNLLMIVYTAINVPYAALMGVMTSNPLERTSLAAYRFVGVFTGSPSGMEMLAAAPADHGSGGCGCASDCGVPLLIWLA